MKRICLLALAALAFGSPTQAAVSFTASGTLSSPTNGAVYHSGGATAHISYSSSGQKVAIDGATGSQQFYVSYAMHLERDSGIILASDDNLLIVTCDAMVHWHRWANGTGVGILLASEDLGNGSYTGKAYSTITDQGNSSNTATKTEPAFVHRRELTRARPCAALPQDSPSWFLLLMLRPLKRNLLARLGSKTTRG